MIEWLLGPVEITRWIWVAFVVWSVLCQMMWFDGRRHIKRLLHGERLLKRMLQRHGYDFREDDEA